MCKKIVKKEQFETSKIKRRKYFIKKLLVQLVNQLYSRYYKKIVGTVKDKTSTTVNYSELKKQSKGKINKTIDDRIIIRVTRNLFELENEEDDYYKPIRVGNFLSKNYIEYESNGDRNKTLSIEEYFSKIRPLLKDK